MSEMVKLTYSNVNALFEDMVVISTDFWGARFRAE